MIEITGQQLIIIFTIIAIIYSITSEIVEKLLKNKKLKRIEQSKEANDDIKIITEKLKEVKKKATECVEVKKEIKEIVNILEGK